MVKYLIAPRALVPDILPRVAPLIFESGRWERQLCPTAEQ